MSNEKQDKKKKSWFNNQPVGVRAAIILLISSLVVAFIGGICKLVTTIIPLLDNRDTTIMIKLVPTDTMPAPPTDTATLLLTPTLTPILAFTSTPALPASELTLPPTDTPTIPFTPKVSPTLTPASLLMSILARISMTKPPAEFVLSPNNAEKITQWISIPLENNPNGVAFSPDGKQLAVAASNLLFYDIQTMQVTRQIEADGAGGLMAFPSDWALTAVLYPYTGIIRISSLPSGSELYRLTFKDAPSIAFSPDGKLLAAVVGQVVMVLDSKDGSVITQLVADGLVTARSVVFSPDGKILACGGLGIFLWDTATWQQMPQVIGHDWTDHLSFSPDGRKLVAIVNGQSAKVFEIPVGNELYSLDMGSTGLVKTNSAFAGVAFSPDNQLLALAMGGSSAVKVWAMSDGHELRQLIGHTQTVKSIAFSANGTALATTSDDQTVRLWGLPAK